VREFFAQWKLVGSLSRRHPQQEQRGGCFSLFSETVRTQYVTFFEQLLPFKNGAWRFAKEAGVQILPVCIQGGHDAFNHNWIVAPASLVLTYSEPSFVTDDNPHEASMARVSEWMTSILKQ
jgi:1-acyl-sn-glycerol-3-phosphate acyltransferase